MYITTATEKLMKYLMMIESYRYNLTYFQYKMILKCIQIRFLSSSIILNESFPKKLDARSVNHIQG